MDERYSSLSEKISSTSCRFWGGSFAAESPCTLFIFQLNLFISKANFCKLCNISTRSLFTDCFPAASLNVPFLFHFAHFFFFHKFTLYCTSLFPPVHLSSHLLPLVPLRVGTNFTSCLNVPPSQSAFSVRSSLA